jgi:HD domain
MGGAPTPKHASPAHVSPWRYLPHVVAVTMATVVLPLVLVEVAQSLAGIHSIALAIPLAIALSVGAATIGASLWKRRPGARDMLFWDLMLVGFARRLWTERNLAQARRIVGEARSSLDRGGQAPPRDVQVRTLERLARALDSRDPYTHGHSQRVAQNAHLIASRMGLPSGEVAKVRVAAAVHDAGKINTSREILNKPGRLTDDEFEVIKRHPVDGAEMIAPLRDPEIIAMVRHHHERLDGTGYPDGQAGEEIPVGARIIAVADTFDAITSVRPYRSPRKQQAALQILKEESGERLDAGAVGAFLSYYSGRRSAAWSSLALAVPERLMAFFTGGAGPIAQGAAATVAAVGITGALAGPILHPDSHPTKPVAAEQRLAFREGANASSAAGRAVLRAAQPAGGRRGRPEPGHDSAPTGDTADVSLALATPSPNETSAAEPPRTPSGVPTIGGSGWEPETSTDSLPGDGGSTGNSGSGGDSGSGRSGSDKSGSGKSGSDKSGSGNSGSGNSGSGNSGSGNSDSGDSGSGNSGPGNSGGSGSGESGSGNSGSGNSGSGNSGSGNSGSGGGNSGSGSGGGSGSSGSGSSGSGEGLTDLLGTILNPILQSPVIKPIIRLPRL